MFFFSLAAQPAPKLKSTSSPSSTKESNGHANRVKNTEQTGEFTSGYNNYILILHLIGDSPYSY